jgi:DNA polymerase III delta prime subunit
MDQDISSLALDEGSVMRLESINSSQAKGFIFCLNKSFYHTKNWDIILAKKILKEDPNINNCFIFKFEQQKTIGIDDIKELSSLLTIKAVTDSRIFIIDKSERMSIEASNSLLKVLEELPERTYVLLTTTLFTKIVPTIRSRLPVYFLYSESSIEGEAIASLLDTKDFKSILNKIHSSEMSPEDYNQLTADIAMFIIDKHPEYSSYISSIIKGQQYNINPKLVIETMLLLLV